MIQENQTSASNCEVIKKRKSWRSYKPIPLAQNTRIQLIERFSHNIDSPFEGKVPIILTPSLFS